MQNPDQGSYVISRYEVAGFVCLNLIDHADAAESFFDGNNVSAMVATAWSERYLLKSRLVIRGSNYFLPFIRGDLISDAGVFS
jgi:hypothetical protein